MGNLGLKTALGAAVILCTAVSAQGAMADPWKDESGHGRRAYVYREEPQVVLVRRENTWRGRDGRHYCRRSNGTTGLVIGAAAGALVGRELDGGRDRTTGTVVGAAGGALLGREIDRGSLRCR